MKGVSECGGRWLTKHTTEPALAHPSFTPASHRGGG
jgi:hypothetical protein